MANIANLGLAEFKTAAGFSNADVLRNPKTNKLFLSASNGKNYRVQGDLDLSKELCFLVEDGDLDNACLINKGRGAEVLTSI